MEDPDKPLKEIQRLIVRRILRRHAHHDAAHGSVRGRSSMSNALVHLGQPCVVTIDIRKFFPHVTNTQVSRVFNVVCKLDPDLAHCLTRLTTRNGHLPTGSPASPDIANHVLSSADALIKLEAQRLDLKYSRYVDDISVSGKQARDIVPMVIAVLARSGFRIHRGDHKLRIQSNRGAQIVTGYIENRWQGPSVSNRESNLGIT